MCTKKFTSNQLLVFEAAKAQMKGKAWFRGVCCDNFPEDSECLRDPAGSISRVVMETSAWDAPRGLFA